MRHVRRVVWLQWLAGRRRRAGDTAFAERLYRRALAIAERHLPDADLATARVRNDLAVLLKYTGGFDEAAELYAAAYEALGARLGPEHPEVATVLHNIGGLAHAAGRPADGEAAARRAVEIRDAAVGADHPDAAADRAALAAILAATGRHSEARALLEAALAVFERVLGDDHYKVAVTLGNLGALDTQRGDLASAERRLRRALAIKERSLGPDHLELAATLGTLGVVRRRQGDTLEARELYRRALALYETRGLEHHPHVTVLQANLDRVASVAKTAAAAPPDAIGSRPGLFPVAPPRA
jgi:tetratricopeptide (TPR) repeat protein